MNVWNLLSPKLHHQNYSWSHAQAYWWQFWSHPLVIVFEWQFHTTLNMCALRNFRWTPKNSQTYRRNNHLGVSERHHCKMMGIGLGEWFLNALTSGWWTMGTMLIYPQPRLNFRRLSLRDDMSRIFPCFFRFLWVWLIYIYIYIYMYIYICVYIYNPIRKQMAKPRLKMAHLMGPKTGTVSFLPFMLIAWFPIFMAPFVKPRPMLDRLAHSNLQYIWSWWLGTREQSWAPLGKPFEIKSFIYMYIHNYIYIVNNAEYRLVLYVSLSIAIQYILPY